MMLQYLDPLLASSAFQLRDAIAIAAAADGLRCPNVKKANRSGFLVSEGGCQWKWRLLRIRELPLKLEEEARHNE